MAHQGVLHNYTPKLIAFEHAHAGSTKADRDVDVNTILWIGGLGDGLLSVRYPAAIAAALPVLAEVLLSSSYKGWATGSLKRDARELGECVRYFRTLRLRAKIVLMGHSTGCQDIMEYVVGEGASDRPPIDGGILQAGVSDREAWVMMSADDEVMRKQLHEVIAKAKEMIDAGSQKEVLPRQGNPVVDMLGAPVTAYRAYSLLAEGGDDDYFSSDLSDATLEQTFGKVPGETKMMFLWGSEDPYVPSEIDHAGLLGKWAGFVKEGGGRVDEAHGGVVEGATHNLNDDPDSVVQDLVSRVVGYIKALESDSETPAGMRL